MTKIIFRIIMRLKNGQNVIQGNKYDTEAAAQKMIDHQELLIRPGESLLIASEYIEIGQ